MRAAQRTRLMWLLEQIVRLANDGDLSDSKRTTIKEAAATALKIAQNDEAKYIGRVPPIRPSARR